MHSGTFMVIAVLFLAAFSGSAQEPGLQELFMRGNIAYGNGDYTGAEASYRGILKAARSAEVHYNLGNALAQQGKWSEAAYHYMRAHALNPNLEAASANLLLAAERLGLAKQFPKLPGPARLMSEKQWALLAAAAFWAALLVFFHIDFVRFRLPLRRTVSGLSFGLFLVCLLALVQHELFEEWSVVSTPMATLRVAPTEQSPGESMLIEGEPIRILGEQKGFFHVMTPGGDEGFILHREVFAGGQD